MATLKGSLPQVTWGRCWATGRCCLTPARPISRGWGNFPSREGNCVFCVPKTARDLSAAPPRLAGERVRILFKVVLCSSAAFRHLDLASAFRACSAGCFQQRSGLQRAWGQSSPPPRGGAFEPFGGTGKCLSSGPLPLFSDTTLCTHPLPDSLSHLGTKHVLCL